jgi:hypothetical protein
MTRETAISIIRDLINLKEDLYSGKQLTSLQLDELNDLLYNKVDQIVADNEISFEEIQMIHDEIIK